MANVSRASSLSAERLVRWGALAAGCVGCFLIAYQVWVSVGTGVYDATGDLLGRDFMVFYTGWRLLLEEPAALYDLARQQELQRALMGDPTFPGVYAYVYPPAFAALLAPLGLLPYRWSYLAWELLGAGALVWALHTLRGMLPALSGWRWWAALGFAVGFPPFFDVIGNGQNSFFSVLLHVLILRALLDRRPALAGALIGLGMLKPQLFVPILPLALLVAGWRVLPGFAAAAGAQAAISVAAVGTEGIGRFVWLLRVPLADAYAAHAWKKFSWDAFFALPLGADHPLTRPLTLLACGATFLWVVWVWLRAADLRLAYAVALLSALLVIPVGAAYSYDLYLIVPAAMLAIGVLLEAPAGARDLRSLHWLAGLLVAIAALLAADRLPLLLGWQPIIPLLLGAAICAGRAALRAPAPAGGPASVPGQ